MIPGQFDYVRPANLDEVLRILRSARARRRSCPAATASCRCSSCAWRSRPCSSTCRRSGLDGVRGPTTRCGSARGRPTARSAMPASSGRYPASSTDGGGIGDPQVRNWGTIGGSCAHADPTRDWPAVAARGQRHVCARENGERVIAARDFFLDTFTTAIEPSEVLTEVRIPRRPRGRGRRLPKARAHARATSRPCGSPRSCGSAPTAGSCSPASASPASPRRRSPRPTPRRCCLDSPDGRGVRACGRGRRRPRAARSPTSAARPTTSVRWSPS